MKVSNLKVYDLEESIKASKYPMSVDIDSLNSDLTDTVIKLGNSNKGEGHDQFLTGIRVAFDLTFTNKAWVELERYRFVEFVSSQSTMHRISKFDLSSQYNEYVDKRIIDIMNELKETYNQTGDKEDYLKLLYSNPSGFELTARLTTNYRALKQYTPKEKITDYLSGLNSVSILKKIYLCLRNYVLINKIKGKKSSWINLCMAFYLIIFL